MVSTERASKSEQALMRHYSRKINRLRDKEGKNCRTRGSCQFLSSYDYKEYSHTYYEFLFIVSTINIF